MALDQQIRLAPTRLSAHTVSTPRAAPCDEENHAPILALREVPHIPQLVSSMGSTSRAPPKDPFVDVKHDPPFVNIAPPPISGDPPPYTDDRETTRRDNADDVNQRTEGPQQQSSPEPKPPTPQFIISKGGPLWSSLKSTVQVRDQVVLKRIGLEVQERNYNGQWKHTSGHLEDFLSALGEFMAAVPSDQLQLHGSVLKDRYARLEKSASHLKDWQARGNSDVRELTKWEGMLAEQEEELYHQFRGMVVGPNFPASSVSSGSESGDTINFERLSESSGDPLENAYYDKVGDLHLIREHIFNVDAEHSRRVIQREVAIRSGDYIPRPSERQTYEQYVEDRQELIKEYAETNQEMERLKELCTKRDIKVSAPDFAPFLDLSRSDDRPPSPPLVNPLPKIVGNWNPDRFLLFGGLDKKNRIMLWQDNVRRALKGEPDIPAQPVRKSKAKKIEVHTPPSTVVSDPPVVQSPSSIPAAQISARIGGDHEAGDDDDETPFRFGDIQDGNLPTRRYSEPRLSEYLRGFQLTPQSLEKPVISRSESGIDALKFSDEAESDGQFEVKPLSTSLRRRFPA